MSAPPPADTTAPDVTTFRAVLGRFATGVSVMTTTRDGVPHAMTASAVASVSLEPLLVLVCVERSTVMAGEVVASGGFALTFLDADQEALSNQFADASRALGGEQFEGVTTRTAVTGSPILEGGLGWLDCRVWDTYDGGDHLIVVGEVVALAEGPSTDPLLYYRSAYRHLAS